MGLVEKIEEMAEESIVCISHFNDCRLCEANIKRIEPDKDLQDVVDRFIEGHAKIKMPQVNGDLKEMAGDNKKVAYADVSLERVVFLASSSSSFPTRNVIVGYFVHVHAFRSHNTLSIKSRLSLCAEDIRQQLERLGNTSELCSQLGAVLGMLGDCCRAMRDVGSAISYFEESVVFLSKFPTEDMEVTHTLSVSLSKIGDLKYYKGDLQDLVIPDLWMYAEKQSRILFHEDIGQEDEPTLTTFPIVEGVNLTATLAVVTFCKKSILFSSLIAFSVKFDVLQQITLIFL
ncbi:hypothetical protein MKX01_028052 [Papaver californicum]|nr:hypothetical protein MKX01_028052 [Papaver californicum]